MLVTLGDFSPHLILFKPFKNGSYQSKWQAWLVLAKALTMVAKIYWKINGNVAVGVPCQGYLKLTFDPLNKGSQAKNVKLDR